MGRTVRYGLHIVALGWHTVYGTLFLKRVDVRRLVAKGGRVAVSLKPVFAEHADRDREGECDG